MIHQQGKWENGKTMPGAPANTAFSFSLPRENEGKRQKNRELRLELPSVDLLHPFSQRQHRLPIRFILLLLLRRRRAGRWLSTVRAERPVTGI